MSRSSMHGGRSRAAGSAVHRIRIAAAAVAVLAWGLAASCMPLPPEGGGIDVGGTSDQWTVRFDPSLGTPTSMVNRALQDERGDANGKPVDSATAAAAVLQVFHSRPEWFHLRPGRDEFRLVRDEARGWLRYMRFEQTYQGLSVAGAGYEAHVLPNGRVGSLEGRYFPDLQVDTRPVFGESQAVDRARSVFLPGAPAASLPQLQYESENGLRTERVLMVMPHGSEPTLAWGIVVPVGARDHARVYVDARSGVVLGRQMIGWSDTR